jgi:hypothetical protein
MKITAAKPVLSDWESTCQAKLTLNAAFASTANGGPLSTSRCVGDDAILIAGMSPIRASLITPGHVDDQGRRSNGTGGWSG